MKRYVAIWFRHLLTDRALLRQPELSAVPFVLSAKQRGRMIVMAVSTRAEKAGIETGMVVADARAVLPELEVLDFEPDVPEKLLTALAEWMIRYSPQVAVDLPDGLLIDATGCAHLWGGETAYLKDIVSRLKTSGYDVRVGMADTIGTAWAVSRYSRAFPIIDLDAQQSALAGLPPHALRLDDQTLEKMAKLGLSQIKSFIHMPPSTLRRRFGQHTLHQIGKALGQFHETFTPVQPPEPYQERLPCVEPIRTATGIEIALKTLLETICKRLVEGGKGIRQASLKCFRVDGNIQEISIGTNAGSCSASHLFKLFEQRIAQIEPDLGIELFLLDAPVVEDLANPQEALWDVNGGNKMVTIAELLDRLASRSGTDTIHRYLPAEHHWPERALVEAPTLRDRPETSWRKEKLRPVDLLPRPERIQVSAPVPDYPPMLFRYQGVVHKIKWADGPDRIEQEWWLSDGLHRDYYSVEDDNGNRYWIFRLGHYGKERAPEWFIHGFYA
ncbi:DNA polymerase Y family protein [Dyadobacter sp. CY261]|uniref:Y-family DNA polymerase n=1 Tax=Dyadobacter sp. CY261 TaxID=2907203 RepID=UPI001F1BFDB4|nr:DNA polymerase Y family protein [Dyadobacter sp. CY261]MCF0072472.1 DNA polymerase Y family protein [Dyadobacter sp. CY261]